MALLEDVHPGPLFAFGDHRPRGEGPFAYGLASQDGERLVGAGRRAAVGQADGGAAADKAPRNVRRLLGVRIGLSRFWSRELNGYWAEGSL